MGAKSFIPGRRDSQEFNVGIVYCASTFSEERGTYVVNALRNGWNNL